MFCLKENVSYIRDKGGNSEKERKEKEEDEDRVLLKGKGD